MAASRRDPIQWNNNFNHNNLGQHIPSYLRMYVILLLFLKINWIRMNNKWIYISGSAFETKAALLKYIILSKSFTIEHVFLNWSFQMSILIFTSQAEYNNSMVSVIIVKSCLHHQWPSNRNCYWCCVTSVFF